MPGNRMKPTLIPVILLIVRHDGFKNIAETGRRRNAERVGENDGMTDAQREEQD